MKAVTVKELKEELTNCTPKELRDICLRLARFKKENKELMTYLLYESSDEALYIEGVKMELNQQFEQINTKSPYLIKKSFRKILRTLRKYARYSQKKETEVEFLLYFCTRLNKFDPPISENEGLQKFYSRLIATVIKKIAFLHEDLQFDYNLELNALNK